MFVLIRLILIVVRGYAGSAFACCQFSESTNPTLICEMLFVRNFVDARAIEWGVK
jgi:hypothetical protein